MISADRLDASEPDPEPDPDPDSATPGRSPAGNDGFETGPRRTTRSTPPSRGATGKRQETSLRVVSRVEGALALDSSPSDQPERIVSSQLRPVRPPDRRPAQVVPLRLQPASASPARVAPEPVDVTREPPLKRVLGLPRSALRPPVLASEALRKDLVPPTPASRAGRVLIAVMGLLGLSVALITGGSHGLGIPLGGAFLALAVLGLFPMTYPARAAATVTIAGSGLTVVTWATLQQAGKLEPLVLIVGLMVLAMALLFRSWHRASLLARALVAAGIALCTGWLWMSATLRQLLVLEGGWQEWLPPLVVMPLPVLLLLSLLAFMDSRTTGACHAWGGLLLGWYTVYSWSVLARLGWPATATGFDLRSVGADIAITLLSAPLFEIAVAMGLAQLLAAVSAKHAG